MKKNIVIPFVILFFLISCSGTREPRMTVYSFRIINKTKTLLYVKSKFNNYNMDIQFDTIIQNKILKIDYLSFCYKNYHDTLVKSIFYILKINTDEGNLKIDPYLRTNWTDSTNLEGLFCKGGTAYYNLVIKDSDL